VRGRRAESEEWRVESGEKEGEKRRDAWMRRRGRRGEGENNSGE
jgi:hypothetical protein